MRIKYRFQWMNLHDAALEVCVVLLVEELLHCGHAHRDDDGPGGRPPKVAGQPEVLKVVGHLHQVPKGFVFKISCVLIPRLANTVNEDFVPYIFAVCTL